MQSGQVPYGLSAADVPGTTADVSAPLPNACHDLPGVPTPAEVGTQTPPPGVPGAWRYRVCGNPPDAAGAAATGTVAGARAYCRSRQCVVLVTWRASDPNYQEPIPAADGPGGWKQYFTLDPKPASSPLDGRVFATLPTWFYDTNRLGWTGAAVPAFGLVVGVAYLQRTWWDVDGRQICSTLGSKPPDRMSPADAARPSPDCGYTFTSVRAANNAPHRATVHKRWLIVIATFFGAIAFTVTFDSTMSITVREVQTLGH
jgi:hypothetical protein